jgi:hypothetical protein
MLLARQDIFPENFRIELNMLYRFTENFRTVFSYSAVTIYRTFKNFALKELQISSNFR